MSLAAYTNQSRNVSELSKHSKDCTQPRNVNRQPRTFVRNFNFDIQCSVLFCWPFLLCILHHTLHMVVLAHFDFSSSPTRLLSPTPLQRPNGKNTPVNSELLLSRFFSYLLHLPFEFTTRTVIFEEAPITRISQRGNACSAWIQNSRRQLVG